MYITCDLINFVLFLFQPKKSVFSGFGGFNKAAPSSFNFLANLTNGNKNTNGTATSNEIVTAASSTLFTSKAASPGTGLFGVSSATTLTKSPSFGITSFQSPSINTSPVKSAFTPSKTEDETAFKIQPTTSDNVPKSAPAPTTTTASLFSISSTSGSTNKSLFSSSNSTPFKIQPISTPAVQNTFGLTTKTTTNSNESDKKSDDSNSDKKMKYYAKLKGLNESVSDWIKKHVEQTPLCILTPIFKDYEKYLNEIQDEYQGPEEKDKKSDSEVKTDTEMPTMKASSGFGNNTGSSLFSSSNASTKSVFGNSNNFSASEQKPLTFGINPTASTASTPSTTASGFSFGITSSIATTSSPFSLATNTSTTNQTAPFSFGIGKPFSFSPNANNPQNSSDPPKTENEEDDEPPKVEFTPVVEENSVFDKRCKIFVKKDGNFADKGVGTLYIKKIEESGKHQLLVRANTNLGTVLLNLILGTGIPTQRMGKNNVMLVCIPTPDCKPPPTPVLIRVKTGEEADELLEILNKYKK